MMRRTTTTALGTALKPSSSTISRALSTTRPSFSAWSPGPSPPRLPKDEQEIFEQLQKQSTGAFSTPRAPPKINQSPHSEAEATATQTAQASATSSESIEQTLSARVDKGDEMHPHVRRGAPHEFEGDVNPKTGENGGPKTEPLRWGGEADWSYNGRVTDF